MKTEIVLTLTHHQACDLLAWVEQAKEMDLLDVEQKLIDAVYTEGKETTMMWQGKRMMWQGKRWEISFDLHDEWHWKLFFGRISGLYLGPLQILRWP